MFIPALATESFPLGRHSKRDGVKDLSLSAAVTAVVRDEVIVVGVLVVIIVQRGFDFVVRKE